MVNLNGMSIRSGNKRGLTLIETLFAMLIAVIAIGGTLEAFHYNFILARTSEETSVALQDMANIMERIACTPFNNITSDFPDGVADGTNYEAIVGGYTLVDEHISVNYTDADSDPLEIIVNISWSGAKNRQHSMSLSTFKTE